MTLIIVARCSCGAVQFESKQKPVIELYCHCADCRDAFREDYAELSFFQIAGATLTGVVETKKYVTDAGVQTMREYCTQCNDVMFDRSKGVPTVMGVASTKLVAPFASAHAAHVWTQSKIPELILSDNLPTYEKGIPRDALLKAIEAQSRSTKAGATL